MLREAVYQRRLIKKLKASFPGCVVLKNDPNYIQGFPDLLVLHKKHWAALEVKNHERAPRQPNQQHFVDKLNNMSYASFVYPENEEEVFDGLQQAFRPYRKTRHPVSK